LKDRVPATVGEVRQLLGLLGYHRKHVQVRDVQIMSGML
jgi:hypothetical protein